MVMEHTLSEPSVIYWSAEERAAFRTPPHDPPVDAIVRIAAYRGSRLAFFQGGAHNMRPIASSGPVAPGTRATLVLGALVLQVESDRWRITTGQDAIAWPPPHADQSEWIWRPQHSQIDWPVGDPLGRR